MKTNIFLFIVTLFFGLQIQAQHISSHDGKMANFMQTFAGKDTVKVGVLVYNGMIVQDFAGPVEVFSKAKGLTNNHYAVYIIGLNKKPIQTENNIVTITPQYSLADMPACDYFVLPGGTMSSVDSLRKNTAFQNAWYGWEKRSDTSKLISICTAAYFLGEKGLLNGKNATTHFFVADDFASLYPQTHVIKDVRFVDAGNILTSSGVTSGIDLALYIVGKINGEKIKGMIARALQYEYHQEEKWPVAPMGMHFKR